MGANQSELTNSISKIPSLEKKPDLLKQELRSFVAAVSLDQPLPVKVDTKVAKIMLALLKQEVDQKNSEDILLVLSSFMRLLKIRTFYTAVPKNPIHALIDTLKSNNDLIVQAALDTIALTLVCRVTPEPSQENKFRRTEAEEQMKIAFFETRGYEVLINLFNKVRHPLPSNKKNGSHFLLALVIFFLIVVIVISEQQVHGSNRW